MKKNVHDIYGISALHYINAGEEGLLHFHFLLNAIVSGINNSFLEELNMVLARVLYKSHGKDKFVDTSYRCISMCLFLSKATDMYLRDLCVSGWDATQAANQYQGTGKSHELASLLLTESIQYSKYSSREPLFVLSLDAKFAFDKAIPQILIRELFH